MHSLRRISLSNWYLVDAKDIDIRGEAALVGPTGAGKSSIQDAIQTVITGVNQNRMSLNASASGRSSRSVLEYCLGMTGDPGEGGKPLRSACETVIALTFRDEETGEPLTVGVALSARSGDSREEVLSRFIVPGCEYSVERARRRIGATTVIAPWAEIAAGLRKGFPRMEEYKTSAERFTADMLALMRGEGGPAPNARHFLRAFSNALAFKPIFDPTLFVRDFVLEPDPLDVERVRRSVATWRELSQVIADVEAKLARVARIDARFGKWGRARLGADGYRWQAAAADARRAAHDWRQARKVVSTHASELALEKGVLASRREWIRGWDEEIRSKEALLAAAGGESQLRQIRAEASLAERDMREAETAWGRLVRALGDLSRLGDLAGEPRSPEARAVDAARQALALVPAGAPLAEAFRGRGETLEALLAEARGVGAWSEALDERADAMAGEVRRLQELLARAAEAPAAGRAGAAPLSREALKLLAALKGAGIPAVPLCDVVEVADPSWQYAAEALLGRGREAIIVEPAHLARAFDLMWSDRNSFSGCTLVKTSATRGGAPSVPPGSILEALRSGDPHARAFLAVRIGAFRKAETDADLDRLERGVMRNGKTSSGMGLSVQRDLKDLLFGRGGATAKDDDGREAARLTAELAALRERMRTIREAARRLPAILEALSTGPGPFEIETQLANARLRRDALSRDRAAVEANDGRALREELAHVRAERDAHASELAEEVEPRIAKLQALLAHAEARLGVARTTLKAALGLRRRAGAALEAELRREFLGLWPAEDDGAATAAGIRAAFRDKLRTREAQGGDVRSWLSLLRNEASGAADAAEAEARREGLGALRDLSDYAAQWNVTVPVFEADDLLSGARWASAELTRLDANELRGYRDTCERAAEEMRRMMREDLLARLSEKLGKVSDRMEGLNRLLARHRFTGQTYSFTHAVDARFSRMHELAAKAAQGELTDAVFESSMDEVEAMIEGAEDAARLADYRQYFTFEIVMTDPRGGRTTLSSRAVKGSGGEAQVPFYVAIAASLASAYFPGHLGGGKPKGMGLALFDEAFNKLDVPNTQALLRFFREMGLQLLIAGPEDKRATFTEVLDTIVLVNKSLDGRSVFIDAEHPGEAARAALAELNPDHRGIEGFRAAAE